MKNRLHTVISNHWFPFFRGRATALLYLLGFMLLLPLASSAETVVSGTISEDTTWTVEGMPYVITGDVTVRHTATGEDSVATLTIEPGVTVRFRSNTRLAFGYSSNYRGALVAQGTAEAPIVFTSDAATPAPRLPGTGGASRKSGNLGTPYSIMRSESWDRSPTQFPRASMPPTPIPRAN